MKTIFDFDIPDDVVTLETSARCRFNKDGSTAYYIYIKCIGEKETIIEIPVYDTYSEYDRDMEAYLANKGFTNPFNKPNSFGIYNRVIPFEEIK